MEDLGDTRHARKGLSLTWRRWQLWVALLGVILGIAVTDEDLEAWIGAKDGLSAQITQDDHEEPVWSLVFADRTRLASSTITGEVRVKDLATGRVLRLQEGENTSGQCLAFTPGGRTLAAAGNGRAVHLWDMETGTEQAPLSVGRGFARAVAFSPDGTMLAVGTCDSEGPGSMVALWDWPGRRRLLALEGHRGGINVLDFSPDGSRLIAVNSSGEVIIWDAAGGEPRARRRAHESPITGLAISPDGRLLATTAGVDGIVRLWDAASGEPRGPRLQVPVGVAALAFSPDGMTLVMAGGDGLASLRDVASGREVGAVRVPKGSLQSVAFSRDGRVFATGGVDGSVRFWDVAKVRDRHS